MNTYFQASARKYRPQRFDEIVGQEAIVQTLLNALRLGRVSHAYLFCGARGTGKTTLARLLAKAINCHQPIDNEPCGQCPACKEIASGRCLDILEIDGASNRGIDDIRNLNETVGYATSSCPCKVFIIDEVHMLTKEAFNALLKTLEEPPPKVKFFFATTEPHKVPPTIISRCQRFDLKRISSEKITDKLAAIAQDNQLEAEREALFLIAEKAQGGLRDALSLFDQLTCFSDGKVTLDQVTAHFGLPPHQLFASLDKAIAEQNLSASIEIANDVYSNGFDIGRLFEELMHHFRRHLEFFLGESTKLGAYYTNSSSNFTSSQCLYILDTLFSFTDQLSRTPSPKILLELALLRIIRSGSQLSIDSLVDRLIDLEQKLSQPKREEHVNPPQAVLEEKASAPEPLQQTTPYEEPSPPPVVEEQIPSVAPPPTQPKTLEEKLLAAIGSDEEKKTVTDDARNETLLRFTAVELEGILKKGDR